MSNTKELKAIYARLDALEQFTGYCDFMSPVPPAPDLATAIKELTESGKDRCEKEHAKAFYRRQAMDMRPMVSAEEAYEEAEEPTHKITERDLVNWLYDIITTLPGSVTLHQSQEAILRLVKDHLDSQQAETADVEVIREYA